MRITESRLRQIIREELGSRGTKYQFDIPYDIFVSGGHPRPRVGDDVTHLFKDDLMPPLSAEVVSPAGRRIVAGVADPVVELEFTDRTHARSWAFNNEIPVDAWPGELAPEAGRLRENEGEEVNVVGRHIFDEAQVLDGARVTDNAMVTDEAQVSGNASVSGNAVVSVRARVRDDAVVSENAVVQDDAEVYGNAVVTGNARLQNRAQVGGDARIGGTAEIRGGTWDGSEGEITSGRWMAPGKRAKP